MTPQQGVDWLAKIPRLCHPALTALGAILLHRSRKQVAYKGLSKAFPEMDAVMQAQISRHCAKNQLSSLLNLLHIDKLNFQTQGLELIKNQSNPQQGGILLSVHLGIADASTWLLNQHGISTKTIVGAGTDGKNKESQWVAALLDKINCPYIERKQGFMVEAVHQLNQGHWLTFHCDMNAPGEKHSFFGHPTQIPAVGIQLAMLTNVPIVFCFGWQGEHQYQLKFEPFTKQTTTAEMVAQLVAYMEKSIRAHPEHWIWHYNRWK